jgi:hypothetical protein
MVTLLPLIHSAALLSLLRLKYCVDGRTWISHSVVVGTRQYLRPLVIQPLFVRGGETRKFQGLIFDSESSKFLLLMRARGGHSTHHEQQLNPDNNDTFSAFTTTSKSASTTTTFTTPESTSPHSIQCGGGIAHRRSLLEESLNETKTTKIPSSNDTTPTTLSPKAAAKQEVKELRKKEKEAKKRHKQIAKQLRVCTKYINKRNC